MKKTPFSTRPFYEHSGFTPPSRPIVWAEDPLQCPHPGWWDQLDGLPKSGSNRCSLFEARDSPCLAGIYQFQHLVRLINEGVTKRSEELDNLWSLLRDYVAVPHLGLPSLQVAS